MSAFALPDAAEALARIGYVAIPLNADRRPVLKGWPDAEGGETSARRRFEHCAAHGMALVTRGFIVVDLDRGHADGVDGVASFAALVAAHGGDFPDQYPCVRTRRHGVHLYLASPAGVEVRSSASRIAPGVDIKAARSIATCPPTDGYSWIKPLIPVAELPPPPGWLVRAACPPPPPSPIYRPVQSFRGRERYAETVFHRELSALAVTGKGQRNAALYKAAARLGELVGAGMLPIGLTTEGLLAAAEASGLSRDDGRRAVEATIASGLRKGLTNPSPNLGGHSHGR
jgi:hypothetical protein